MKVRSILLLCVIVIGALAGFEPARASEILYDRTGFVSGQQAFVVPLDIPGPGTLTVTLSNIAWPEQLASLSLVLGSASGLMGPEMEAGSKTFDVTGGRLFAQWFGSAQGALNLGVYSLDVEFKPSGVMPVPLPASLALFGSGLVLLGWQRRQRKDYLVPSHFPA